MSETLSSHEIEDVLSSIRRLVSEDLRPAAKPAAAPASSRTGADEDDKLLLTPSFRVVRPPADAPQAVAPAPVETAAVEAADHLIWAAPGEADPGYVEEVDVDPETVSPATLRRGHWTADSMPEVNWTQDDEDWSESEAEPMPFTAHPRGAAALDEEPLAKAWAERAEAEVRAEIERMYGPSTVQPEPEPARVEPEAGPGLFDAEEAMFDDEILRDIVREIIREELAGTLGERITRNVRKLVRVEVNRALTAREFE